MYSAFLRRKPVADCSSPSKAKSEAGRQCLSLAALRYAALQHLFDAFLRRYHDPLCGTHHRKTYPCQRPEKTGIPSRRILHCRYTGKQRSPTVSDSTTDGKNLRPPRIRRGQHRTSGGCISRRSRPTKRTTLQGKGLEPATQVRRLVSLTAPRYADTDRRHRRRLGNTCSTYPSGRQHRPQAGNRNAYRTGTGPRPARNTHCGMFPGGVCYMQRMLYPRLRPYTSTTGCIVPTWCRIRS